MNEGPRLQVGSGPGGPAVSFSVSTARIGSWGRTRGKIIGRFRGAETIVVAPPLFVPPEYRGQEQFALKHHEAVARSGDNSGLPCSLVRPPGWCVGLYDAVGLTILASRFQSCGLPCSVATDDLSERERQVNLVTLGSPSSNLVSRAFCERIRTSIFDPTSSRILIGDQELTNGHFGVVILAKNPWNRDRVVAMLAGLGTVGTGAAVTFFTRSIDDHVIPKLRHSEEFGVVLSAREAQAGYVRPEAIVVRWQGEI